MSARDGFCGETHSGPTGETWECTRDYSHGGRWHEMEVNGEIHDRRWETTIDDRTMELVRPRTENLPADQVGA